MSEILFKPSQDSTKEKKKTKTKQKTAKETKQDLEVPKGYEKLLPCLNYTVRLRLVSFSRILY